MKWGGERKKTGKSTYITPHYELTALSPHKLGKVTQALEIYFAPLSYLVQFKSGFTPGYTGSSLKGRYANKQSCNLYAPKVLSTHVTGKPGRSIQGEAVI